VNRVREHILHIAWQTWERGRLVVGKAEKQAIRWELKVGQSA